MTLLGALAALRAPLITWAVVSALIAVLDVRQGDTADAFFALATAGVCGSAAYWLRQLINAVERR